jgi:hypothetical protein
MKKPDSIRLSWLPDTDENPNFYRIEFPVLLRKRAHGEVIWRVDRRVGYKKWIYPVIRNDG